MIITKDTKLLVHHTSRGEFIAKARRSFSLDEDAYPLIVINPMDAQCIRGEEILPRADATTLELMEDEEIYAEETQLETGTITDGNVTIQPMAVEIKSEAQTHPFVGIKMDSGFVYESSDIVADES